MHLSRGLVVCLTPVGYKRIHQDHLKQNPLSMLKLQLKSTIWIRRKLLYILISLKQHLLGPAYPLIPLVHQEMQKKLHNKQEY
jgi:hypothetical protein